MTRREKIQYRLTLKSLTDEQLYHTWAHEYDAKHTEHVKLILAEMDLRNTNRGAIRL